MVSPHPLVVIVGGPAGTGKSTVGQLISKALDAPFIEGDNLHPPANVDKMSKGIPLTDDDRWDWLADISRKASAAAAENGSQTAVASCSALTKKYRQFLSEHLLPGTKLAIVFLYASEEDLLARVKARPNHYMGANMVSSQVGLMQVPDGDELIANGGFCLPELTTHRTPDEIADEILAKLK